MPIIGSGPITPISAYGNAADLALRIGSTVVTPWLAIESYEITESLNQRNTCRVTLYPPKGATWRPIAGEEFVLTDMGERLFGGSVENITEATMDESLTETRVIQIEAVDYNQIADRMLVVNSYENMTCGDIVLDIIATYLAGDNIGAQFVDVGLSVDKISFNYVPASEAFTKLASICGFSWYIDYYGGLYFFARTYQVSGFEINSANAVFRRLRNVATRDQYRNSQIIRGGIAVTQPQLERFAGDGQNGTYTMAYAVDRVPVVMRNTTSTGAAQTVAIRDLGVPAKWYWNRGQNTINQHSTDVVLTSTEFLSVYYQGQYPLLTVMDNAAEIASRSLIEGGSGRYESVRDDESVDTDNLGMLAAQALLAQYGSIKQDIEFVTTAVPIITGDLLPVSVPELGLSGQFLATNVTIKNHRVADREYTVTATNGQFRGDFAEFFRTLNEEGTHALEDTAVIARPVVQTETLTFFDSLALNAVSTGVFNIWSTHTYVGLSEWSS